MKIYVGLAIADGMFPETCVVERRPCPLPLLLKLLEPSETEPVVNCCNVSHQATLQALRDRYGVDLISTIPATPPRVSLLPGDVCLVLSVRGLPRLTDRREYTAEEIAGATFSFGMWTVVSPSEKKGYLCEGGTHCEHGSDSTH